MKESRGIFFQDLSNLLLHYHIDPALDVESVFEVGFSLGYQLAHIEENIFPNAEKLVGFDIDEHAIKMGKRYLEKISSRAQIFQGDMKNIKEIINEKNYDTMICTGVLMYLNEVDTSHVVETMLKHTKILVAISGLANSDMDNNKLQHSVL